MHFPIDVFSTLSEFGYSRPFPDEEADPARTAAAHVPHQNEHFTPAHRRRRMWPLLCSLTVSPLPPHGGIHVSH
jgi:hypothetical protein